MDAPKVLRYMSNSWRLILVFNPFKGFRLVSPSGQTRIVTTDVITSLRSYLYVSHKLTLNGSKCIEYGRRNAGNLIC